MRISELSETTGIPVATIKYYLREGLLPEGDRVNERLSEYGDRHVRRLGLLRLLRDVGQVPVEALKNLVAATQNSTLSIQDVFGLAADAMAPGLRAGEESRAAADSIIELAGWANVRPEARDRENLAAILELISRSETHQRDISAMMPNLRLADELAKREIADMDGSKDRVDLLEEMVVGQVVFGQMFATLRRLAEEHHSFERFANDHRK